VDGSKNKFSITVIVIVTWICRAVGNIHERLIFEHWPFDLESAGIRKWDVKITSPCTSRRTSFHADSSLAACRVHVARLFHGTSRTSIQDVFISPSCGREELPVPVDRTEVPCHRPCLFMLKKTSRSQRFEWELYLRFMHYSRSVSRFFR